MKLQLHVVLDIVYGNALFLGRIRAYSRFESSRCKAGIGGEVHEPKSP